MPLARCPECEAAVSTEADACPKCGHPLPAKLERRARLKLRLAFWTISILVIFVLKTLISAGVGSD
jgi:uncharacterized paraquat-inducible protein A